MSNIFDSPTYSQASQRALNFIKTQMRMSPTQPNGHIPVSYLTPNIYITNRSYIYDIGLSLLVFTSANDYAYCQSIMNRLVGLQNTSAGNRNGSFDFSYDFYTGKIPDEIEIKTGAVGWLVWGMCYFMLVSGNRTTSYMNMINNAGSWLLERQFPSNDSRFGLLKGGFKADGTEILWCSTEHQCSCLQALQGLAELFPSRKTEFDAAANAVLQWINPEHSTPNNRLYRTDNISGTVYQRYRQGFDDNAWALDCATWAGATAFNLLPVTGITPNKATIAEGCRTTARNLYHVVRNNPIASGNVEGFKPYLDPPGGPPFSNIAPAPNIVWTEGTLGYVLLCMLLGGTTNEQEAIKFMNETIKLQNSTTGGILYVTESFPDEPWEMNAWESVCSSAWLYLLIQNPGVLFPFFPISTLRFDLNGAPGAPPPIQSFSSPGGYANAPPVPEPSPSYTFAAWHENSAGTGVPFNFATKLITSNKTLFAKWGFMVNIELEDDFFPIPIGAPTRGGIIDLICDSNNVHHLTGFQIVPPANLYYARTKNITSSIKISKISISDLNNFPMWTYFTCRITINGVTNFFNSNANNTNTIIFTLPGGGLTPNLGSTVNFQLIIRD